MPIDIAKYGDFYPPGLQAVKNITVLSEFSSENGENQRKKVDTLIVSWYNSCREIDVERRL